MRKLILLMFPIFLSINVVAFDYESYNKGVKAFEIADYEEAMRFWKAALPKENIFDDYSFCKASLDCNVDDLEPDANAELNFWIGYLYSKGWGTVKNYDKAIRHLRKAADVNHPQAQYFIAELGLEMIDEGIIDFDSKKERRKGYGQIAKFLSRAIENKKTPSDIRKEAEKLWNEEELWRYTSR